jgi:hypothetical protein
MVDTGGQLYTIEGVAAALIMLASAYLVVNATSIYTPGDTHISDMQLEVLGSDALVMMNTAPNATSESPLQAMVETNDGNAFGQMYSNIVNNRTTQDQDHVQFMANVSYMRSDNTVNSTTLLNMTRPLSGGEHAVHVTEWVIVKAGDPENPFPRNRTELVGVYLWRD